MSWLSEALDPMGTADKEAEKRAREFSAQLVPQYVPLTPEQIEAEAKKRTRPLMQAIAKEADIMRPGVIRKAFAPFAERGFGTSQLARLGIGGTEEALGAFEAGLERDRQQILTDAIAVIRNEVMIQWQAEQARIQAVAQG